MNVLRTILFFETDVHPNFLMAFLVLLLQHACVQKCLCRSFRVELVLSGWLVRRGDEVWVAKKKEREERERERERERKAAVKSELKVFEEEQHKNKDTKKSKYAYFFFFPP